MSARDWKMGDRVTWRREPTRPSHTGPIVEVVEVGELPKSRSLSPVGRITYAHKSYVAKCERTNRRYWFATTDEVALLKPPAAPVLALALGVAE